MQYKVIGEVIEVPLDHLYVNNKGFNCRGDFDDTNVVNLATDINEHGLQQPIIIQPMGDVPEDEKADFPFRLIVGHRRYRAFYVLQRKTIPAIIKSGLTRQEAYRENLIENIEREDLGMMAEAKALQRSFPDESVSEIAELVNRPRRWVEARLALIKMPEKVQKAAAAGILEDRDIMSLKRVDDEVEVTQRLDQIRNAHRKAQADRIKRNLPKQYAPHRNTRPRSKTDIKAMLGFILSNKSNTELSKKELDAVASAMTWCMNKINDREFLESRLKFDNFEDFS